MSITPDQLPNRVSNFVAYGPEERAADPTNDGEVTTIRPQVYVRYYPGIVVSDLKEGGRSGNREGLVTVHFDPTSIGFKDPISAHMNSDDQTLPILRNSLENKAPITVAIETQRKKKNSESGSPISPLTPIHALRGASHPNGDGDGRMMMGPSGNNTSNRVAFVNGQGTQHLQSVPTEWKSLVNNKSGDLPPEGWRNFAPGEDWTQIGAAVRSGAPTPASTQGGAPMGGAIDGFPTPEQLSGLIHNVVSQSLKEFAPILANQVTQASGPTSPGRAAGKFYEGKQWDARTSDGRINLGGYVVASERWAFAWAYRYLSEAAEDASVSPEDAWTLSGSVLTMASQVQANSYGRGFVADRTTPSHREAEHWVQWTIRNIHPYPGVDADEETLTGWSEEVANEATSLFIEAGGRAGEYFAATTKRDKHGAAPQAKTEERSEGPSEKVIRAFLDVIEKGWDNPASLKALGAQGRENGYGTLRVSMTTDENGVHIAYPPTEGEESGPLESLLIYRLNNLPEQGEQGGGEGEQSPASPNQSPEAGQDTQEQAQPEPSQEQAPAEAPAQEGASAQEAPATPQESTPAPQSEGPADSIIERLKVVATDGDLRAIYEEAKNADLLATKVTVAPGPNGEVIFGQDGQDGFQTQTIGSVVGIIRNSLQNTVAQSAASASEAPADEPHAPQAEAPAEEESPAPTEVAPAEEPHQETADQGATPEEASPAPEAAPDAEEAPSTEAPAETAQPDNEAQRIADEASAASDTDTVAALQQEAEDKGLLDALIQNDGTEGPLGHWLSSQKRRVGRAQRRQK